jgi:hypothetical protein
MVETTRFCLWFNLPLFLLPNFYGSNSLRLNLCRHKDYNKKPETFGRRRLAEGGARNEKPETNNPSSLYICQ